MWESLMIKSFLFFFYFWATLDNFIFSFYGMVSLNWFCFVGTKRFFHFISGYNFLEKDLAILCSGNKSLSVTSKRINIYKDKTGWDKVRTRFFIAIESWRAWQNFCYGLSGLDDPVDEQFELSLHTSEWKQVRHIFYQLL